jgi:hypothetical protein
VKALGNLPRRLDERKLQLDRLSAPGNFRLDQAPSSLTLLHFAKKIAWNLQARKKTALRPLDPLFFATAALSIKISS